MRLANFLNRLSEHDCRAALEKCCASPSWIEHMLAARPFTSDQTVFVAAERIWRGVDRVECLKAFAAHPKIGDMAGLRARFANTKAWAADEQAGVTLASEATLRRLAAANDEYVKKFGYIFLVCATDKTADEMLGILENRLRNSPRGELTIAAGEQWKITQLRLQKLATDEQ